MTTPKTHRRPAGLDACRMTADRLLAAFIARHFTKTNRPVLIAVGGPGGTGKSTLCGALLDLLPDAKLFRMDEYKTPRTERKDKGIAGPHPDANDMALLTTHLKSMKSGDTFDMPRYDRGVGAARSTTPYTPARINLLDGEVATYPRFEPLVDLAIYLDADWMTQLQTRVTRDIAERGHSREKVIETFLRSNLREFPEHGAPTKHGSDIHLFRHEDQRIAIQSVAAEISEDIAAILAEDAKTVALEGLVVPMCTPFDVTGKVDEDVFLRHLDFLAEHGCGRILVGGTTGEFFSLTQAERHRLFATARTHYNGTLLFHASGDCLATTRDNIRHAQDHGADALLALPPIYPSGLSPAGITAYFASIAAVCKKPLVLYDFPAHAKNAVPAEVLASVPHYGVKDSSGSGAFIGSTPHYFTASDEKISEYHARGACGFYSGAANFAPDPYVALEATLQNDDDPAALQKQINTLSATAQGIPAIKARLAELFPAYPPHVRPPIMQ